MPRWLKILLIVIGAIIALRVVGWIGGFLISSILTVAVLAAVGYGAYYLVSGGNKRLPPR